MQPNLRIVPSRADYEAYLEWEKVNRNEVTMEQNYGHGGGSKPELADRIDFDRIIRMRLTPAAREHSLLEHIEHVATSMRSLPDWKKGSPTNERAPPASAKPEDK